MASVQTEHVLVVPTDRFHELGHFQGFSTDADHYLAGLLQAQWMSFRPRPEMEEDPSFKQLIPYLIIEHLLDGAPQIFCYVRGSGQGESRLHSKWSIGVGGHISQEDAETVSGNAYREGLQRELAEELVIETDFEEVCAGMINDDESEVGRVHLGVVHQLRVETPDVRAREEEIESSGFRSLSELYENIDRMETWSRICLEALYPYKHEAPASG
jgi:predicted NUDIX family phosphoesterase